MLFHFLLSIFYFLLSTFYFLLSTFKEVRIKHCKETDRPFKKVIIFRYKQTNTHTLHHNIYVDIIIPITVTITIILVCVKLIAMDRMLSKLGYSCAVICIPVNANNAKFYISKNLLLVKNNKKYKTYNIYRFEKPWILNSLHIRKGRFCDFGNKFMCEML